jgi:hypothetical protein
MTRIKMTGKNSGMTRINIAGIDSDQELLGSRSPEMTRIKMVENNSGMTRIKIAGNDSDQDGRE